MVAVVIGDGGGVGVDSYGGGGDDGGGGGSGGGGGDGDSIGGVGGVGGVDDVGVDVGKGDNPRQAKREEGEGTVRQTKINNKQQQQTHKHHLLEDTFFIMQKASIDPNSRSLSSP